MKKYSLIIVLLLIPLLFTACSNHESKLPPKIGNLIFQNVESLELSKTLYKIVYVGTLDSCLIVQSKLKPANYTQPVYTWLSNGTDTVNINKPQTLTHITFIVLCRSNSNKELLLNDYSPSLYIITAYVYYTKWSIFKNE